MGFFRFRRRIKILPGLWLNASKSGLSTSVGGKGVTVNFKKGKVKTTFTVPGTGLSYIQTTRTHNDPPRQVSTSEDEGQAKQTSTIPGLVLLLLIVVIFAVIVWLAK